MSEKVFFGGNIITMTDKNAEAILIKDGKISAVGSKDDIMSMTSSDTEKVDLNGRCLMPAFIDGHSHLTQYAQTLMSSDLSTCRNFEDIINKLKEFQNTNNVQKGEIIVGFGYDHNNLSEKAHPKKDFLDKYFPENPVVLCHVSGHMGVANSLMLKQVGIDKNWTAPEGGFITRGSDGEPDGYLEENAFFVLRTAMPVPGVETALNLVKRAQKIYLGYGITTIQDGILDEGSFGLLKTASERNELICDVVGYADMKKSSELINENKQYAEGKYINRLKLGGYKIFLDGSPQGRTAWMRQPYLKTLQDNRENYCGYPIYTDDEVKAFADKAKSEGQQLLAHCNGDAAALQFIKAYDGYTDTRPVIIHGQFLPKEYLPEVKEKGLMPSYFTAHSYYWGDAHIENMGMERAKDISPAKSTAKLGIPFTFHQDTPVLPPDMIDTIWCAVNRITKKGVSLGDDEKVSVYEALKAVTINGAYEYFEENEKGSLEEGKIADLVILSENPLEVPEKELKRIKVEETYKDGEKVWERN